MDMTWQWGRGLVNIYGCVNIRPLSSYVLPWTKLQYKYPNVILLANS